MKTERLVVEVRPEVKQEFHVATRQNGSNMTVEINRFIRDYITQHKTETEG
jgi:hypothetical protein